MSALLEAAAIHREAQLLLLTETAPPHGISIPAPIQLILGWEWVLG